ncbi:hypothetical protein KEM52_000358 [Ascosphaera acerosa]|nr:hypothetical protein KEM52_000358 [Ascosphaera acerosa]
MSDKASQYMTDAEKKMKEMYESMRQSNPSEKAKEMGEDTKKKMGRMGEDMQDRAGKASKESQRKMEDTGR